MSVYYTEDPSTRPPDSFVGAPVRLPHIMLCGRGCKRTWSANTQRQFIEMAAERRDHERTCKGGLIVATGMGDIHG